MELKIYNKQLINPYFWIPFILWVIVGAFLLCLYDSTELFSFVNTHYALWSDSLFELVNHIGEAWLMIVIFLCVFFTKPFRNPWFFFTAIACTVLPALVTQLIKHQIEAPRPMSVYAGQAWVHHLKHWSLLHNYSFPSGHTTGAFSFMSLLACATPPKYRIFGLLFFFLALAAGYARVYLAAHFFVDVYVGSIIGAFLSFLTYSIFHYYKRKTENTLA